MSRLRDFLMRIVPSATREAMVRESREWATVCPNGHVVSIWDLGGIRYKAAGRPVRLVRCPTCGVRFAGRFGRASEKPPPLEE